MLLEIYDKTNRIRLDLIRKASYVQFTNDFNKVGKFTLKVPYNENSLPYLVKDNYILFEDGIVGIIKFREKITSEKNEVTIKGYMIKHILSYRAFLLSTTYKGERATIASKMVKDLCVENKDARRNIKEIKVSNEIPESDYLVLNNTGGQLNDVLEDLLSESTYGYELKPEIIAYDEQKGTNISNFIFKVIKSTDRTIGNIYNNEPVVFSMDLNNLTAIDYIEDSTNTKSIAIVAGEGEGKERKTVEVGDTESSGLDRLELYVDARDLQKDEEMSDSEYLEALKQRGKQKLNKVKDITTFDGSVLIDGSNTFQFNKDFYLGDFVTIIDKQLNLKINLQITAYTKTITEIGEEKIDLKFGSDRITFQELIKRGGLLNG